MLLNASKMEKGDAYLFQLGRDRPECPVQSPGAGVGLLDHDGDGHDAVGVPDGLAHVLEELGVAEDATNEDWVGQAKDILAGGQPRAKTDQELLAKLLKEEGAE